MEKMEEIYDEINPWEVEDVSTFLKYCCPECEFQDKGCTISKLSFMLSAASNFYQILLR